MHCLWFVHKYLSIFSADFHCGLVTRSRNSIECMLKTLLNFHFFCGPALLCSIIAGNFLFALLAEGIHSTSKILFYKQRNLYQSLFVKSIATLVCSFPTFECIV